MRWTLFLAVVAIDSVAAPGRATESLSRVELTWNAPSSCPTSDAVLREVQSSLGATPIHRVVARADVTQVAAEHWSVHLATEVDGVIGERSLDANSCASLASATALIVAWTIDPAAARSGPSAAPAASSASRDEAVPTPTPTKTRESPRGFVATSGRLDLGLLPSAAGGADVTLGASWGPLRGELSGTYWFPQDAPGPVGGTHILLVEGAFRVCVRAFRGARVELLPCAGAGIVHASSDGFGLAPSYRATSDWGIVGGDVLGTWAMFGPLALRASIGVEVPLVRPAFVLLDPNQAEVQLHRAAVVSGRASLGAEVHFP
jgi:hypothetical protein